MKKKDLISRQDVIDAISKLPDEPDRTDNGVLLAVGHTSSALMAMV